MQAAFLYLLQIHLNPNGQWFFFCRVANLPVSAQGRKAEYPVGTLATVLQSVFASMSTNAIESPTRS